jgi:hypothetical protein
MLEASAFEFGAPFRAFRILHLLACLFRLNVLVRVKAISDRVSAYTGKTKRVDLHGKMCNLRKLWQHAFACRSTHFVLRRFTSNEHA